MAVGSSFRVSTVDRAVTPKPCKNCEHGANATKMRPYQWHIVHTEDDDPLMLRRIFRYPAKMCFHDMVAVQEWHLSIRFDPDL